MEFGAIKVGWFDFFCVALVVVGCVRGRKRGMTEEFPNLIQWILIVGAGAFISKPVGNMISDLTGMGKLFWFVTIYVTWAALVKGVTTWIVRSKGDKMGLADTFGKAEYPLGMISGMIRMVLVCMFCLALLNARLYTAAELKSMAKFQEDNFGDISLPTIGTIQQSVFLGSALGKLVHDHADVLLIEATAPRTVRSSRPANGKQKKNAMDYWT